MIQLSTKNNHHFALLGCASLLLAITFLLYGDATSGNWRADDPQILVHTVKYPVLQSYTNPVVWQELSPANLTPWVITSFNLDLSLFGPEPRYFYVHQLLALWLAAIAGVLLLNLWCNLSFSFAGALLFLCGTPLIAVSNNLMTRHYIEGLAFAAFSLYLAVLFLRSNRYPYLVFSCLFYALAMTAKEIYVPLILFLPFVKEGSLKARAKACVCFGLLAAVYVVWRGFMLQKLIEGYADTEQLITLTYALETLQVFSGIPSLLLGEYWIIISLVVVMLIGIYSWFERWSFLAVLALGTLILTPLIPLTRSPEIFYPGRYYLLIWFVFTFSLPYLLQKILSRLPDSIGPNTKYITTVLATLGLIGTLLTPQQEVRQSTSASNKAFDIQANFLWHNSNDAYFIPSQHILNTYWFFRGLRDLKALLGFESGTPNAVPDELFLTNQSTPLYEYDPQCQCMREISSSLQDMLSEQQNRVVPNGELDVRFSFSDNTFRWNFGPYQDNNYYAISDFLGAIQLPPAGEVQLYYVATTLPLVIGYFSEDGKKIYSDELVISHNAPEVRWSRN